MATHLKIKVGVYIFFCSTDMATHLKIVFVSWLLLLVLMEEAKAVVAKGKRTLLLERVNILEKNVAEIKEMMKEQAKKMKALDSCKGKRTLWHT